MSPITKEYKEALDQLTALQQKWYDLFSKSMNDFSKGVIPLPDVVDIGYINKAALETVKNMGTFMRYRNELCSKFICLEDAKAGLNDLAADRRYEGEIANAYSRIKQASGVPERGTEEHALLMQYLGIDPILWDDMSVTFNALSNICTKRAQEGKPPPPGILKTFPVFGAMYKKRNSDGSEEVEVEDNTKEKKNG